MTSIGSLLKSTLYRRLVTLSFDFWVMDWLSGVLFGYCAFLFTILIQLGGSVISIHVYSLGVILV